MSAGAGYRYDRHVRDHPGSVWLDSGSPGGLQEEGIGDDDDDDDEQSDHSSSFCVR